MPHGDLDDGPAPRLGAWQRLLVSLPRFGRGGEKPPLGERLRDAMVKPPDPSKAKAAATDEPMTVEELETAVRFADDKERNIGLAAAPLAAIIGILITGALIANDPAAHLKSGAVNPKHVAVGTYETLGLVVIGLSVVMLGMALARKRLFLGMAMALYGLAVFNLHYWGFGLPFIFGAAWYLVRSYRLQKDLRLATEGQPPQRSGGRSSGPARPGRPPSSKRYTPPAAPRRRPPKPEGEQRAG